MHNCTLSSNSAGCGGEAFLPNPPRPCYPKITVTIGKDTFYGTYSDSANGALAVAGARNAFADKKDAAAQARLDRVLGLYNVALVGDVPPVPQGYVALTVGALGSVKIAGKLPSFTRELDTVGGYFGNGKDAVMPAMPLMFSADVPAGLPAPVATPLVDGRWMNEAFPSGLIVFRDGLKLSLMKEPAPKKTGTVYDYSGFNPSTATLAYTAKTGGFKGTFKLYYDGLDAKGLQHKIVSVSYSGVMVPQSGSLIGLGTGTATIKQKVGMPVYLE